MTINFGLVEWDQVEFARVGDNRKRDEFIRLQSGPNVVRIVTKPYQYTFHKWKEEGEKGYGDKVMCSMYHGSCALCEKGDKPKQRWYVGIIDRKTQSYKILDMSPAIFRDIQKLSKQDAWGSPMTYDVDISVDKNAGANGYYTVMPLPKSPLSDKDVEAKMAIDLETLKKRCTPPTPEEVIRRLGAIKQGKKADNSSVEMMVEATSDSGSDSEFDFPPASVN